MKKGVGGIEMVMPFTTEIPKWFNFVGVESIPHFWVRGKFPNIVVAMIFHFQNPSEREYGFRQLVDLRLLINGRYVPRKGYQHFRIEAEHMLVCDLRVLCSEEEWFGLDGLLGNEWNLVEVACDATWSLTISGWGAFVYEEGSNMEDLLFTCPLENENELHDLKGTAIEILYEGIRDGLFEARNRFPSLDIVEIFTATLEKGPRMLWTAEGMELIPTAENRTYFTGVQAGLLEANRRFPDLDVGATLSTVANRKGIKGDFKTPLQEKMRIPHLDWTTVTLPPSHDPLMQIYMMMMKQQSSSESELKTKTLWKLKESHQVLRNGLALRENAAQNAPSCSKNRYDELIQKFHIQYDAFVGKRVDRVYGVAKYEKDSVVLKERVREIERVFNGVVERLQNSEEFEDVMTAMFLNGLRDGVLEARAILLALCTHTQAHERVTDEATNNQNIS